MKIISYQSYIDFILTQNKQLNRLALNVYPKSSKDLCRALEKDTIFDEIFDYFSSYRFVGPCALVVEDRKKYFMIEVGY